MRPLLVIRDAEIANNPGGLAKLWSAAESFLVVPDKLAVSVDWIQSRWQQFPAELAHGHFAMLTSGSTGEPKVVIGARTRAEALAQTLHVSQENQEVASCVVALPLSYSFAFVNQWLWSHVHRCRLVMTRGLSDPAALRTVLLTSPQSMLCLVGAQVPLLLQHFAGSAFASVHRVHFAGGRFPQESLPELHALFPNALIYNNYGCAEAMPRLSLRRSDAASNSENIGSPIAGVELRTEVDGSLMFRSVYRAVALGSPRSMTVLTDAQWLPTGDLARDLGDGSWDLVGRSSEVFKRFGEKVSPMQLLGVVNRVWPGSAAFYLTRDKLGEVAHVLVLAPKPDKPEVMRVLQEIRAHYSRPHWPYRIEGRDALPLLPNGKPDVVGLQNDSSDVLWSQRL